MSIIFLRSLTRGRDEKGVLVASMLAIGAPLFQLAVYNSPLKYGEQYAHAVEFTFGAANCFVTFWFCLDNWFVAEEELRCIKYGDPVSCRHCIVSHSLKKAELATRASSPGASYPSRLTDTCRFHGAIDQHGSLTERRREGVVVGGTERLDGDEVRDRRVPRARHGVVDPGVDPRRARVDAAAAERVDAAAERQ